MRTSLSMLTPFGRSGLVWPMSFLNSRICCRVRSSDFTRSDLSSDQKAVLRTAIPRADVRTSCIAATTAGSIGARGRGLLARGMSTSVSRGRVLPMCGSSGTCSPKFQELPRPGSQSTRRWVP